jgi:iron(III) transport system ATP-binding protein
VLLFDEPLSNLDAKLRVQMRSEIRRIQQELGITSVYVTHDQDEAMVLSDQIVIMNKGRIQQVGTAVGIYRRPRNRFVADFIGRANFLPVTVVAHDAGGWGVEFLGVKTRVSVAADDSLRPGQTAILLVRPESLRLSVELSAGDGVSLAATVQRTSYLGSIVEYDLNLQGQIVTAIRHDPSEIDLHPVGSVVYAQLLPDNVYLLPEEG